MLGCLTFLLLVGSILLIVAIDVVCWMWCDWRAGISGLIGLISFLVGYMCSVEMSITPRDFWINTEFDIVNKKLEYAWEIAIGTGVTLYVILITFF
ncbi:hypothetical protein [Barnesiella viscericola]|uniref:hypothetical protein n=1 Tax=Barnesiella viscericola TaxID=397865 RepID=UPI0032082CC5